MKKFLFNFSLWLLFMVVYSAAFYCEIWAVKHGLPTWAAAVSDVAFLLGGCLALTLATTEH